MAQLQNPILLVSGRKAARVTSTDALDGDKETRRDGGVTRTESQAGGKKGGRIPFFVAAQEKSSAAVPATGRELQADREEVLLPCTALFAIRTAALSAALSGRLYVHKITRVHICMCVCVRVSTVLRTKSDRKVVKKKGWDIFSLFVCATVSVQCRGAGEYESGVAALCVRKAADWKQWVSLEKPSVYAKKKWR